MKKNHVFKNKLKWIILVQFLFSLRAFANDITPNSMEYSEFLADSVPLYTFTTDAREDTEDKTMAKALQYSYGLIQSNERKYDIERNCESLVYSWKSNSKLECQLESGMVFGCVNPLNLVFGGVSFPTKIWISVEVYCKPRMNDSHIPTKRYHINKPKI